MREKCLSCLGNDRNCGSYLRRDDFDENTCDYYYKERRNLTNYELRREFRVTPALLEHISKTEGIDVALKLLPRE